MLDKLEAIKAKFDDITVALTNPEVVNNNKKFEVNDELLRKQINGIQMR
jgi:peptide chain release factor 1